MNEQFETRCIHGDAADRLLDENRSISYPIYQTASFSHIKPGHNASGFDYTRESNPTRTRLEQVVASLEGAAACVAFSSGMAAISAVFELFAPGDHIICSEDLYGGVTRLHTFISTKNGLRVDYLDTTDLSVVEAAVRPETRAIYLETPSNPMMNVTDLRKISALAKAHGLALIVDNTFLSPYFQNPLALGADVVVHSGSKFLSGHNDTISGFLCTASKELGDRLRLISKTTGGVLAPFDSWLVMRGIKTLAIRMERQQQNSLQVAGWLKAHPRIREVYYVGLPEHPGHAVNAGQARGFGSMISFRTDTAETALRVLERIKLITFAESLGGTESLLTYPMVQTHPDVPQAMREHLGITDTLLRLSVGLEHPDDIIADLRQALEE
ncbi:MAG: PLP-dependent transferase [Oscillospiraceae bacterium]|nr:PLP-dependent transferase [Oscillospiraceae bacterium]